MPKKPKRTAAKRNSSSRSKRTRTVENASPKNIRQPTTELSQLRKRLHLEEPEYSPDELAQRYDPDPEVRNEMRRISRERYLLQIVHALAKEKVESGRCDREVIEDPRFVPLALAKIRTDGTENLESSFDKAYKALRTLRRAERARKSQ